MGTKGLPRQNVKPRVWTIYNLILSLANYPTFYSITRNHATVENKFDSGPDGYFLVYFSFVSSFHNLTIGRLENERAENRAITLLQKVLGT